MKLFKKKLNYSFNVVLIHSLLGIFVGILIIHPLTMVVYWFEFIPSDFSFDLLADVFLTRIKHSFHPMMLSMSFIFGILGGFFGFISGLNSRALKLRRILSEKNRQLIELDSIKSNFLHLISHELRTPLNGIVGFVGLLKEQGLSNDLGEIVDILESSVTRLEKFSLTALKITELSTSVINLEKKKINLLEEAKLNFNKFNDEISTKDIAIHFSPRLMEAQTYIYVDSDLFRNCMDHILGNAIKYCTSNIYIDCREDSTKMYTIIEVSDDGKGFSESAEKTLFQLFDNDNVHADKSTGLSYPLIKLICKAHQGKIEIGNKKGSGAVVKLYIPHLET